MQVSAHARVCWTPKPCQNCPKSFSVHKDFSRAILRVLYTSRARSCHVKKPAKPTGNKREQWASRSRRAKTAGGGDAGVSPVPNPTARGSGGIPSPHSDGKWYLATPCRAPPVPEDQEQHTARGEKASNNLLFFLSSSYILPSFFWIWIFGVNGVVESKVTRHRN